MDTTVIHDFNQVLRANGLYPLRRSVLAELQINLGYLCNQACEHCHVEAGPKRTEIMTAETMAKILRWTRKNKIRKADLTGGAPELTPGFRSFVDRLLEQEIGVTSRCNLTVLLEPGQEDLAEWYARRQIRLVCSLPCYSQANVDSQRGKGVFEKSIEALQELNRLGYGREGGLVIDLVYNPVGANLPPAQATLERDYKVRLKSDYGIEFNNLLTITNLPIKRFAHFLKRTEQTESYRQLLAENFNPETVPPLMCRHLISVDWQGFVYDCDFNQMLNLPVTGGRLPLWELDAEALQGSEVSLGNHCFACTAGAGSSCGGALA